MNVVKERFIPGDIAALSSHISDTEMPVYVENFLRFNTYTAGTMYTGDVALILSVETHRFEDGTGVIGLVLTSRGILGWINMGWVVRMSQ